MNPLERLLDLLVTMFENDMAHFSNLFGGEWWQMLLGILYILVFFIKWFVITRPAFMLVKALFQFDLTLRKVDNKDSEDGTPVNKYFRSVLNKNGDN